MEWIAALAAPLALAAQQPVPAIPAPAADDLAIATDDADRMTVPVAIADAGPYPFVIDTGAQRTVISRELAGTLGLAAGPDVRLTAMTGTSIVGTVIIPSLSVSTMGGQRIEAPALEAVNLGAPGMLGLDTLQGHAVTIDFDHGTMAVRPSHKRASRREEPSDDAIVVRARSQLGQLVVTDATYRGATIRVILDTGSAVSMGNLALQSRARRAPAHPIVLTSVTGATLTTDYTQLEEVRLGDVLLRGLPIAFADAAPFRRFNLVRQPALMLGMDALRLFRRVVIDFPNREVRLTMPRDALVALR